MFIMNYDFRYKKKGKNTKLMIKFIITKY